MSRKLQLSQPARLGALIAAVLAVLLFVPEPKAALPAELPEPGEFVWGRDELWATLEQQFRATPDCPSDAPQRLQALDALLSRQLESAAPPEDARWQRWEKAFFELTSTMGGCEEFLPGLLALREKLRREIKALSQSWSTSRSAHDRLYRLLYGTRTATEELLLQSPPGSAPELSVASEGSDGPVTTAATPSRVIHGVRAHSGDILLSRGGAPTSAFIARGNDHPGNFSHAALLHIDEKTKMISIVEAHIERGVDVSTLEQYLGDEKLRIALLRLRPSHPALKNDPLLPHRAANEALDSVEQRHVPYDFAMNFRDPTAQFCSEVVFSNYSKYGIDLWSFSSTFARPGLARWMNALGVRHFETHSPSDLEYDPNLVVVAEWFDAEALREDRIENAVIDAMLDEADAGAPFDHDALKLPLARILKAYSAALNAVGQVGPIPEGMSATVALRAEWLTETHECRSEQLEQHAWRFEKEQGYFPPYFRLLQLARETRGGCL